MDLWYYRTFVAESHRQSNVAAQLLFGTRDMLERRFVSGEDRRAGGMIFELENDLPAFEFENEIEPLSPVVIREMAATTVRDAGVALKQLAAAGIA